MIACLHVGFLIRRIDNIMRKINDNVIIPLRRHIRYGQFYTVRIGACDIHVSCKLDGFAVQFVKPCVPCGVIREFHYIMIIIVPINAAQLYHRVWRPNVVVENIAVLFVHARIRIGELRCVLQMWKVHIISFHIYEKWVVLHMKHHPF